MKTKKRLHKQTELFRYISSTEKFKAFYFVALITAMYGSFALGANIDNFYNAIIVPFTFPFFNILVFGLTFVVTINSCSLFDEFNFYIIRLKNRKNYIKELVKSVLFVNILFIIILLMLFLSGVILFKVGMFDSEKYQNYNVSNLLYMIFYMSRYVLLVILISIANTVLYKIIKERNLIILNIFFLSGFLMEPYFANLVSRFQLLPWAYFSNVPYTSFTLELGFSLLYIVIILFVIFILANLFLRKRNLD